MEDQATVLSTQLKKLVSKFEHRSFVAQCGFLANAHIRQGTGQIKLRSPVRQVIYLVSLYHSTDFGGQVRFDAASKDCDEIIKLLNQIEKCYGLKREDLVAGLGSTDEIHRMIVTNSTFLNYYLNAPLSFIEQDIERIKRTFKHFEPYIFAETGLKINDFIEFFRLVFSEEMQKYEQYFNIADDDDQVLGKIRRGKDPRTLTDEEKLHLSYLTENRIYGLGIEVTALYQEMEEEKVKKLLSYFTLFRKEDPEYLYYTDACAYLRYPIMMMDGQRIVLVYSKQLISAIYTFLYDLCTGDNVPGRKVSERRDEYLEQKTTEVFQEFFGEDARIYPAYYVNGNEKDLLVLTEKYAFIIECKAGKFRMPFRDAAKAYSRISDDLGTQLVRAISRPRR